MRQFNLPARQGDVETQRRLPHRSMCEHLSDPLLRILGLNGDSAVRHVALNSEIARVSCGSFNGVHTLQMVRT